jgi:hypothetical protein
MTTMRWRSLERVAAQVRAAPELVQRPAQDEREIRRIPERSVNGHWRLGVHFWYLSAGGEACAKRVS